MPKSIEKRECAFCDQQEPSFCNGGPGNQLREYAGWNDLSAHCDETTIVRWVNELAAVKERQRYQHARYNKKQQMLQRAARRLLAPDEIAAVERQAERDAAVMMAGGSSGRDET